ncbi:GNAT family N-acetyltransferase [Bacillus sp. ISL-46]|uniref:GNAT family N-acetyltransferase n=1 Tax=Bacillus sp. ISL-46 TaxID=2819129 RepID=UPI001BE9432F|nr:GNAT family N-acetyltransferase [Bacillus sp. ISL-46]MBT2724367.1 GNAT family N-acetyltransferase [Bacillus sp. ISL-46]
MSNKALIQKIEELSMNALPALQTLMYDGWILRFSEGYTKRANSINPIYSSSEDFKRKIENNEKLYRESNLKVVYKMTPLVGGSSNLDSVLENSEYTLAGETSVQLLPILEIDKTIVTNVVIYNKLHENWFHNFCILNNISENHQLTLKKMLENIVPTTCFILLIDDNSVVACGLGVLEDEYIGLFDIVTHEKSRNKGYGAKLIRYLIHWGKENGAKNAYLQVELNNIPALNLYYKLGFKEQYRYWYRVKK